MACDVGSKMPEPSTILHPIRILQELEAHGDNHYGIIHNCHDRLARVASAINLLIESVIAVRADSLGMSTRSV